MADPPSQAPTSKSTTQEAGRRNGWLWLVAWLIGLLIIIVIGTRTSGVDTTELTFTEFLAKVDTRAVDTAVVHSDGRLTGKLNDGSEYTSRLPTQLAGEELAQRLEDNGVTISATGDGASWSTWIFAFAPIAILIGFFVWMSGRTRNAGGFSAMQRSRAKVIDEQRPDVRFTDIAGYEGVKAELGEVIDFLRNPARFRRLGAKGPRGVLMLGPPGTGKTLLARAIAGEANVPFLSVTGSTFVELFVGVGAARVRDLFEQARQRAPAIVFIDEIDAVGQRRGANPMMGNDEREQTLNQLLAEMDGFDPSEGIIVLAATNRPDVLDLALLRPGRFDRHIVVPLPNRDERRAILEVHCKGKPLAPEVSLDDVARSTPGFSGADLANLANEAAINAVRHERDALTRDDFSDARDRILLGRRDRSTILLPEERHAVAAHEAGHALVAALSPGADPVAKVTILPSGPALGAMEQLPLDDRHLYSETYLKSALAVRLGGRAAELVVIGEASSGAADDLAKATEIATRMVRELGMSGAIGPVGYPSGRDFLGPGASTVHDFSDATQRAIDAEVARLLSEAQAEAEDILRRHQHQLGALAAMLLEHETVDGVDVYALVGLPAPEAKQSS